MLLRMCGLAGVVNLTGAPVDPGVESILRKMGQEIAYRGPDDEQIIREGPTGFVFRRLSIVDVEGGRQPFRSADGSLTLMVNGEIYNHLELRKHLKQPRRFVSHSDCEVILYLYEEMGLRFLDLLVGMYAIALYDRNANRLILARDRFGIKPLFYAHDQQRLIFGSEIKAILQHPDSPREFDWASALTDASAWSLFAQGEGPPVSFFKGVTHLPGGHYVTADTQTGKVETVRYWSMPLLGDTVASDSRTDEQLIEGYGELLSDSVKKCLMSDVEYGAFLSGGLDSVAICALAAPAGSFHTFSVLGQSTFTNGDSRFAHIAAKELKLSNHQVLFEWQSKQVTAEQWKDLLWLCESPWCGPEQLYKFQLHRFAKATRPGLKVMLSGQGSDEFNGGYGSVVSSTGYKGYIEQLEQFDRNRLMRGSDPFFSMAERPGTRPILKRTFLNGRQRHQSRSENAWDGYLEARHRDLQMYNCWHEDRTAAGNNIENRVPFLDHRLVEYANQVPQGRREAMFWDKRILRQAMKNTLQPELTERPKGPFFFGKDLRYTNRMMLGILSANGYGLIEEAMSAPGARDVFEPGALDAIIKTVEGDPEATGTDRVLRLVNMCLLSLRANDRAATALDKPSTTILSAVEITDWDAARESIALKLAITSGEVTTGAHAEVLRLADNVLLVKLEDKRQTTTWYFSVDDKLKFELTEADVGPWLKVVREIDGERSLQAILDATQTNEADIRKYLNEAIEYGVIEKVDDR